MVKRKALVQGRPKKRQAKADSTASAPGADASAAGATQRRANRAAAAASTQQQNEYAGRFQLARTRIINQMNLFLNRLN